MFDIGFFELALIGVVLLVVMGPEKLPEVARQGAFFIRKARAWLTDMKTEMDTQSDGGLSSFKEATREIAELKASLAKMGQDVMSEVDEVGNEMQDTVASAENAVTEDYSDLDAESYFNKLISDDVEPSLVDDEVAGKPVDVKKVSKTTAKKAPAKKVATKKSTAKKATPKKPAAKKVSAKTTPKTTAKKTTAAKRPATKKAPAKKPAAKKTTTAKKPAAKKKTATPRKKTTTAKKS